MAVQFIIFSIFLLLLILSFHLYLNYKYAREDKKVSKMVNKMDHLIELYENFKLILHISKADFLAFFYYDYNKRYITTQFQFSIDKHGKLNKDTENSELPVTINSFSLKVLNSDDSDVHEVYKHDIKNNPVSMRGIYNNTYKMYWQNIFKDNTNPIGYIVLAYEHEYKISKKDREQITNLLKKIKDIV